MKPYYEHSGIVIFHGDALDVLHDESAITGEIAAVVMDPPFASGARTEARKAASGAMVRGLDAAWVSQESLKDG